MVEDKVNVLAIVPYHWGYCAGQRFRIERWSKELEKRGFRFEWMSFSTERLTDSLHHPRKPFRKASLLIDAFIRQFLRVSRATKPDLIYLYREASLAGPALIERFVRRWNVPIVYDIDEPLFVPYVSPSNGALSRLKFFSKVDDIFAMSDSVLAVNRAIADHAKCFNEDVETVPMAVDLNHYVPRSPDARQNERLVITWVGTRTNQPNIEVAISPMRELRRTHDFLFRIVADYEMQFEGLTTEFVPWSLEREIHSLQTSDIGIVPVGESVWAKWKFFFKTIQYMAVGLPVIGSAVGSNLDIIEDGVNGFLASTDDEWAEKLRLLAADPNLRKQLGENARKTVLARFDLKDQVNFLEKKFRELARGPESSMHSK